MYALIYGSLESLGRGVSIIPIVNGTPSSRRAQIIVPIFPTSSLVFQLSSVVARSPLLTTRSQLLHGKPPWIQSTRLAHSLQTLGLLSFVWLITIWFSHYGGFPSLARSPLSCIAIEPIPIMVRTLQPHFASSPEDLSAHGLDFASPPSYWSKPTIACCIAWTLA